MELTAPPFSRYGSFVSVLTDAAAGTWTVAVHLLLLAEYVLDDG